MRCFRPMPNIRGLTGMYGVQRIETIPCRYPQESI